MDNLEFLWPFEVKSAFRSAHTRAERDSEFARISEKFSNRIPIIVEPLNDTVSLPLPKQSFLPPQSLTPDKFLLVVSRRIGEHEGNLQFFLNGKLLKSGKALANHYNEGRNEDGFLYLNCSYGHEILVATEKLLMGDEAYAQWVASITKSTHSKKMFAGRVLDIFSSYAPVILTDGNCKGRTLLLIVPFDISKFSFVAQISRILNMEVDLFVGDQHRVKGRTQVSKLYSIWKDQSDGVLYVEYRDKANCRVM